MFPRETTDAPAHRTLAERLRDVFGTAIEFATLGEATFDATAPARVRYLHAEEVAAALQAALSTTPDPAAPAARPSEWAAPASRDLRAGKWATPAEQAAQPAPPAAPADRLPPPATAAGARPPVDRHPVPAALRGSGAAAPADVREHPHRVALRRPSRLRRPGATPPRAPVCTMPVVPAPAAQPPAAPPPAPHSSRG